MPSKFSCRKQYICTQVIFLHDDIDLPSCTAARGCLCSLKDWALLSNGCSFCTAAVIAATLEAMPGTDDGVADKGPFSCPSKEVTGMLRVLARAAVCLAM